MTVAEWQVVDTHKVMSQQGRENWQVDLELPDGSVHLRMIPLDALEWRAAIYGIDPVDVEQLLDIVLHENQIPDPEDNRDDAAARAGMVTSRNPDALPVSQFRAVDSEEARAALELRLEDAKANRVTVLEGTGKGSLDALRSAYLNYVDLDQVAEKARYVQQHRESLARQQSVSPRASREKFTNPYDRKEA